MSRLLPCSPLAALLLSACAVSAQPPPETCTDTPELVGFEEAPAPHVRYGEIGLAADVANGVQTWFAEHPGRRLYVQLDRPLLRPGETLWVRSWDLGVLGLSGAGAAAGMRYELLDPRGAVVQRKDVKQAEGGAFNDLEIPAEGAGGAWTLRATTADGEQLDRVFIVDRYRAPRIRKELDFAREAYGAGETVNAVVTLAGSTGGPLVNQPARAIVQVDGEEVARLDLMTDAEGAALVSFDLPEILHRGEGLLTVLVDDAGVTESISRAVPLVLQDLQLSFFPEGGDLVAGLPGRVYFEATDAHGQPADVAGRIEDDQGNVVNHFRSLHDGLGRVSFLPEAGRSYRAVIEEPAGVQRPVALPESRPEGCVLRSYDDVDGQAAALRVAVRCTVPQLVVVVGTLREQVLDSALVEAGPDQPAVVYLQPEEPSVARRQGVARVTVLDSTLRPLAERLVYRNPSQQLQVEIQADRDRYAPRDEVSLTVFTKDADGRPIPAEVALSVADDTVLKHADDERGHILSRLYLEPEIEDEIDDPAWYFDPDEPDARKGLDLVLGAKGWRRFAWHQVFTGAPNPPALTDALPLWQSEEAARQARLWTPQRQTVYVDAQGRRSSASAYAAWRDYKRMGAARRVADLAGLIGTRGEALAVGAGGLGMRGAGIGGGGAIPDVSAGPAFAAQPPAGAVVVLAKEAEKKARSQERRANKNDLAQEASLARPNEAAAPKAEAAPPRKAAAAARPQPADPVVIEAPALDLADADNFAMAAGAAAPRSAPAAEPVEEAGEDLGGALAMGRAAARPAPMPPPPRAPGLGRRGHAGLAELGYGVPVPTQVRALQVEMWAPVREFPTPSYTGPRPEVRSDFRETLLWAPQVQTDEQGVAHLRFPLSDAVTTFRATAEGLGAGMAGRAELEIHSLLPFTVDARLPVALSYGDRLLMPLSVRSAVDAPLDVSLAASFGPALTLEGEALAPLHLQAGEDRTLFVPLLAQDRAGRVPVTLSATAGGLSDQVERSVEVVPRGFPRSFSASGDLEADVAHSLTLGQVVEGSLVASLDLHPGPLSTLLDGLEGLVQTPGGCFEQTSSTNYPNVLVLDYLRQNRVSPRLQVDREQVLQTGYQRLAGYQVSEGGFETWGSGPGKEALSAYGLRQFTRMKKVFGGVSDSLLNRDRSWLLSRRNGKGGYDNSGQSAHGYGSAPADVLDTYITWALVTTGTPGLDTELSKISRLAASSDDAYILALATSTLSHLGKASASAAAGRLVAMQAEDGSFKNAQTSIMRSGGNNLTVETTALATLALLQAGGHTGAVNKGAEWIRSQRQGQGTWGATQATVLSLETLTEVAKASARTRGPGSVTVYVDGQKAGAASWSKGHKDGIEIEGLARFLDEAGGHRVTIDYEGEEPLPYTLGVRWRDRVPASSDQAALELQTRLSTAQTTLGENVRLTAEVINRTDAEVPSPIARIGLPAGLEAQTWQLEDMKKRGEIAFFETRAREVTLYWDGLHAGASHNVKLDLVAALPGSFAGPASSAYPYYDDDFKSWADELEVVIAP